MGNKRIDDNLILGPGTRGNPLNAKLLVDFDPGNVDGVALDVAPSAASGNERAGVKLGSFFIGQDPAKSGSSNFGIADADGALVHEFVNSAGARPTVGPEILFQSALPLVIAPTGSMGDDGVLTSGTACALAYAHSYVWLPADAIETGSAAGWYYTTWSTTTAAVVYNNVWDGASEPSIPASPTAFVSTGPGAFTGPTTNAAYISLPITLAQSAIGSAIRVKANCAQTNNANAKTLTVRETDVGGALAHTMTLTSLANADGDLLLSIYGSDEQLASGLVFGSTAVARVATSKESFTTSAAWVLALCASKADATDVIAIEFLQVSSEK